MKVYKLRNLDAGAILEGKEKATVVYRNFCKDYEFYLDDNTLIIYAAKKGADDARKIGNSSEFVSYLEKKYREDRDPRRELHPVRVNNNGDCVIVFFPDREEAVEYANQTDYTSLLPPVRMWEEDMYRYVIMCKDKDGNFADVTLTDEPAVTPFAQFLSERNLKMKYVSERFNIPYRTVQNWKAGINRCPDYVLNMMQELIGIDKK